MANVGSIGIVEYVENFMVDSIASGTPGSSDGSAADGVGWLCSGDTGNTAFAPAVAAGRGKHAAGALDASDNDMIELCSDALIFYGQEGYGSLEVCFQVDSVADLAFNIGLNDDVLDAGNTLPIELSGTTWTSTGSTFLGLVYDVDATNDEVHCFWVDDDTDTTTAIATLRMNGALPVASKWMIARVSFQDRGSGNGVRATFSFKVNGKTFEKTFNTTVDRDAGLCAYMGFENRAATAHNVYIKYIKIEQAIAD